MGLYKKQKREQQQIIEAAIIIDEVSKIRQEQPRTGVRKLQVLLQPELRKHNIKLGRDGLFDLLREFGLLVKMKRYRHYTTDSKHGFYKYPNKLKQTVATAPNHVWVSDITYIEAESRYHYLFLITDIWSKKIVGWSLSQSYAVTGAIEALQMAFKNNKVKDNFMHHSDRGLQYCCKEYTALLKNKKAVISMTQNSDPYENAVAERVNGILKTELLQNKYDCKQEATKAIAKAIDIYNTKRPHLSIGLLTPEQAHNQIKPFKQLWKNYHRKQTQQQAVYV